ncbi:hypothetical protein FJ444_17305 [Aestuariibacter sp. GS-14]|uniref:tyrosine-protein kinase family protein n=1 Tax=Aestuariibacter sp. GS-14 TaxID=2590670 RepID=UPI001129F171|nr:hypothetical protein [Aestuariibacter sp. GS-14]TPV55454.1 hypothetical protein FJ444_17305 [Aestuariibacter sp. GS-14]
MVTSQRSKGNFIERLNSFLVHKLTGKPKYASVSYRYMCKSIQRELKHVSLDRAKMLALSGMPTPAFAVNLALFLGFSLASELNARVLLIDSVVRHPDDTLSDKLGLIGEKGFFQLCTQSEIEALSLCKNTQVKSVDVLPSGQFEFASAVILDHGLLDQQISKLSQHYDYLIFTQGDIREDTRYMAISERVDLNLLVVEENRSFMHDIDELYRLFRDSELDNLKLVMTT